jgi:site-specific DNA-methyltransferase (adenine-specific)
MEANQIYHGDCMELLPLVPDASVDMVLCDLPYGTTQNKWDSVLPLDRLWVQYKRVVKPDGAIVLFSQGIFTARLILSNQSMYKYSLVWDKVLISGFLNAKKRPLSSHEDIVIFYEKLQTYNPQRFKGDKNHGSKTIKSIPVGNYGQRMVVDNTDDLKYPRSILRFAKPSSLVTLHPTQKPVPLCEYLIKTYTNPGEIVLDNCLGSGTTAIACINTGRQYIGIEKEEQYFNVALERIKQAQKACIQHTLDDMLA